jgi:lipoprotein NlpI
MENRKKAEASFLDGVSKYHSGDHAGAITNYTESIRAYPEFALAYQNLGFIQNDLSQLRPALQNFYKSLELDPSLTYSRFYIWSIRGRLGEKEQAAKELIAYVRSLQGIKVNDWTAKIGDYLIGTSGDDDFLGAARASANNMEMMKGHLCQVCYYTGMKHLLGGDKNKAEILFENAVFVNKSNVPEYYSAEAELRNLNSTRQP